MAVLVVGEVVALLRGLADLLALTGRGNIGQLGDVVPGLVVKAVDEAVWGIEPVVLRVETNEIPLGSGTVERGIIVVADLAIPTRIVKGRTPE